jgi:hypothetical protein
MKTDYDKSGRRLRAGGPEFLDLSQKGPGAHPGAVGLVAWLVASLFLGMAFSGWRLVVNPVIVLQNTHAGPLKVIKLAAIHCFEEYPECKENNRNREGYQQVE